MRTLTLVRTYLCLVSNFLNIQFHLSLGWRIPRLILNRDMSNGKLNYPTHQNHTVFFHSEDSGELYVGLTDSVLKIDVEQNDIIEEFPLTTDQQDCSEGPCENVITVIEKVQDSLFVCGTNGHKPLCWKLVNNQTLEVVGTYEGTGISPYAYTHNTLSLTVEGDLYAADNDGRSLQFRRKAGSKTKLWMYDKWLSEPTFISAAWVQRQEDADNEKIYVFFQEKNSDLHGSPWISRVARVCKVDEGGSKRFFQHTWTSFLKARLVCGYQKESLYFDHLQDVYVLHAENWTDSVVYALFSSSWNSTAVCIYSMEKIDQLFENSAFKGYNKEIPNPRPGTCVKNSRSLPLATVNVVKDHPEMSDWIHSTHPLAPFYISNNNYTKIAVDRVRAADRCMHNVLLLATDSGKIHKILEDSTGPFIISETQLSSRSAVIQSMKLDSKKRKLVVGLPEHIATLDLQRCQDYNGSCEDCVLARDPYCAWSESGCTPTVLGATQNITGQTNVCHMAKEALEPKTLNRTRRATPSSHPVVHSVPLDVPFYLSCPIHSYHAVYTWEHQGQSHPCLQMQSECLHLIPAVAHDSYGDYKCVSKERDYTKVVREYRLTRQTIPNTNSDFGVKTGSTTAVVPQIGCVASAAAVALCHSVFFREAT